MVNRKWFNPQITLIALIILIDTALPQK